MNQRGQTELASGNWDTYFIDRWLAASLDCAYAITEDGVKISNLPHEYNQIWLQRMERMEKRTYTLSFLLKNIGLLSITFTPQGSDYTEQTLDGGFIISFTSEANLVNPAIRLLSSTSVTVSDVTLLAAKLELGSTQTLAHKEGDRWILNEIPDFGEQLRRCQRYYFVTNANHFFSGWCTTTEKFWTHISTPVPMRAIPAISVIKPGNIIFGTSGANFATSANQYEIENADAAGIKMAVNIAGLTLGAGVLCDGKYAFSADL